jgi:glutamyl/glutaminyl-tRNA synthetase
MFSLDPPEFAHLPLLLNSKGQKLSKRFGDVSVTSYKEAGYLPEALLNGIALLGWNPPHREDPTVLAESTGVFLKHEVLRVEDMIAQFNLDKVSKSGAKFDIEKL